MTEREQKHLEDAIRTLRERYETQLQNGRDRGERIDDQTWSADQRRAILELLELDALERATRDLGERAQGKLRDRLALARDSDGISVKAAAGMLGRSRALVVGWLKRAST